MRFLGAGDVDSLVDAIDTRYASLVATAAHTGARFGELAALRDTRLDLLRGTLTIVEQLTEVKGQLIIRSPKTPASRRQIALPRTLADMLAEHLSVQPPVDGYVFTSPMGALLRRTAFRRRFFLPAVRASVGEPMRFHDLRHSHVAMLIAQGEHPKVIQTRLGHSSIQVTLDRYGHLFEGLDEAAAARLDDTLTASRAEQTRNRQQNNVVELHPGTSETP
jgi:integrase